MVETRLITPRFGCISYTNPKISLDILTTNHAGIYDEDITPLKEFLSSCQLLGLESDHVREGKEKKKYFRLGWRNVLDDDVLYLNPLDYFILSAIKDRLANEAVERHQKEYSGELIYPDEFDGLREIAGELKIPHINVDVPVTQTYFNAFKEFETISDRIHSILEGQSSERTRHMLNEMTKLSSGNQGRQVLVMGASHLKDISPEYLHLP